MSPGLAKAFLACCAAVALGAVVLIALDPGDLGPWLTLSAMVLTSVGPIRALMAGSPPER